MDFVDVYRRSVFFVVDTTPGVSVCLQLVSVEGGRTLYQKKPQAGYLSELVIWLQHHQTIIYLPMIISKQSSLFHRFFPLRIPY